MIQTLFFYAFCIYQVIALGPHIMPQVVLPEVSQGNGNYTPDIALVDTALHSVQQDIHQMRHTINFTKRHACASAVGNINFTDSATSSVCLKANILMNLLKEAEDVAEGLELDTYYFHRKQFSPREVAGLLLQGLGLLGTAIVIGYFTYYAIGIVVVSGVLLVDILTDLPFLFARAMFIPFFLIAAELFVFGYFLLGSFSFLLLLSSAVESLSYIFAHTPLVLECLGMATLVTALLSLFFIRPRPFGTSLNSVDASNIFGKEDETSENEASKVSGKKDDLHKKEN